MKYNVYKFPLMTCNHYLAKTNDYIMGFGTNIMKTLMFVFNAIVWVSFIKLKLNNFINLEIWFAPVTE